MGINKSPRRIDRRAGGRSKKVNLVGQLRRHYDKGIKHPTKFTKRWPPMFLTSTKFPINFFQIYFTQKALNIVDGK